MNIDPSSYRRSSRLAGDRPDHVCIRNYTNPDVEEVWKSAHESNTSSSGEVPQSRLQSCLHQTLEVPRPVQPHSTLRSNSHPISSPKLGDEFEASNHPHHHDVRTPNSEDDFERSKNTRLDLPAAGERVDGLS